MPLPSISARMTTGFGARTTRDTFRFNFFQCAQAASSERWEEIWMAQPLHSTYGVSPATVAGFFAAPCATAAASFSSPE